MPDVGYYTLPVLLSFEGVDKNVNSKLGKMFGDVGKKGGKDLSKGMGEGLKSTEADLKKAGDAYNKLRDKASDALGKVRKEEAALQDLRDKGISSGSRFVAAEERLATARRNSTRAVRDANDSHTLFLNTQKKLGDGADDLGGKLSSVGRFAGSAGKAMASAGVIAGGAALAGIALLGAGVAKAGRELYDLGAQFDDLSDTLQVKTGLTGAALDALKGSVEKLGTTNVPSTFAQIGDIAAEVTRNLHLTGQPLEDITSRLANLSRMGQDVDVRSLGKAFRGFGIDVKDQVPALNGLYEASTKSGLSIDDMLAAVVKGGPALRQLGLGFGESAALIASFEEAGLDGEKGMAALNKAFAYFSKEGIPVKQGLTDIIARIKDLGSTPQAGELATKVFGGKGGAAFLEAIQNGTLDLQSLSDSLQTTGLDINDVSDDTADWAEKWQDLKNEVAVALEPLAGTVFDQVNGQLDNLSIWVKEHKSEIIDFFVSLGEGAISAAEVTTSALAGVVDFLHLFDTIVMNSLSWLPGYDDEAAKAFNDSLGDLSTKLNEASDSGMWKELREKLHDFGEEAKIAADNAGALDAGIGNLAGRSIDITTSINGQPADLGSLPLGRGGAGNHPSPQPGIGQAPYLPSMTIPGVRPGSGGGGSGVGINLQIAAAGGAAGGPGGAPRKVGSDSGLLPQTVAVKDQIAASFGNINDIGGWRPPDGFNEHSSGRAIDVMIPNWSTPGGQQEGDQVAAMALKNPNVKYVLWKQTQWNADGTSKPMSDRGSPTQNHMDHVHVYTYETGGAHPTGTPPTGLTNGSAGTLPMTGIGTSPGMVNAYGTGYEPGIGTPGVNEYGEPGYYQTDPKDIRQSQQAIADADERVKRANQQVAEAEARRRELDVDASESQKIAADNSVENARADAEKAKREAADARTDAQETQKGTFTGAKEAKKGKGGKGGSDDLSGIGGIFSSFLTETFGLDGSIFPDIGDLMPVKMAGALMGALMPRPDSEGSFGATSSSPFGIPDVSVPPMPPPGVHAGAGALPGPSTVINVDGSTNVAGNVGWDRKELDRGRDAVLNRAVQRIPVGS